MFCGFRSRIFYVLCELKLKDMLTKDQKKKIIHDTVKLLRESKNLVFVDFSGIDTTSINKLKQELKKAAATYKVTKKTLLKLALKELGVDFDPLQFRAQVGGVFVPDDLSSVASTIYKFSKELAKAKKNFQILGNYDFERRAFMGVEEFTTIAKLPSREALLTQMVGILSGPIRAFMYIVNELSKKTPAETKASAGV